MSSASFTPSLARTSVAMNGLMYGRTRTCSAIASATLGSACPMFTPISWLLKSRYRLPSTVKNSQPRADATAMGRVDPCCCQS